MTLGIMQPYLFPYIGYYQLISAVDKFVFYDDVNFIKQGWVNRNRILQNNQQIFFTIPVKSISSFAKICDTQIDDKSFQNWKTKFFKTLQYNYSKAPYFKVAFEIVENVLTTESLNLNEFAKKSIINIKDYIGIKTPIIHSSTIYNNQYLSAEERVIDICKQEKATSYINVSGGVELYDNNNFQQEKIELNFIKSNMPAYKQFSNTFLLGLSIIDVLMFCSKEEVANMMSDYVLFKNDKV